MSISHRLWLYSFRSIFMPHASQSQDNTVGHCFESCCISVFLSDVQETLWSCVRLSPHPKVCRQKWRHYFWSVAKHFFFFFFCLRLLRLNQLGDFHWCYAGFGSRHTSFLCLPGKFKAILQDSAQARRLRRSCWHLKPLCSDHHVWTSSIAVLSHNCLYVSLSPLVCELLQDRDCVVAISVPLCCA